MKALLTCLLLFVAATPSYAASGVDSNGINATGLQLPLGAGALNGAGIGIGQVEGTRPGKSTEDGGPDDAANSARAVVPAQVYMGSSTAVPGNGVTVINPFDMDDHAQQMASIMISTSSAAPGVAPNALLHASGQAPLGSGQRAAAQTANFIATRNGGDITAINMSIGLPLDGGENVAGTSHLSRFVDWSADEHDVLYVIAGREDLGGAGPVPSDNFNGITVGGSSNIGGTRFGSTWAGNVFDDDADGDRVSIDLLAPATLLDVVHVGGVVDNEGNGTSIATPHVTGAIALLQQYGKHQFDNSVARWTTVDGVNPNPRRHQVMKAILLNSADKLVGVHGSERTIFNHLSQRWDQTPAYSDPAVSLDIGMGAGHLNVGNALANYEPGEYEPGEVSLRGWDFGTIGGGTVEYEFNEAVPGKTWIAATLVWDRLPQTNEVDNSYVPGTTDFVNNSIDSELTNLNLYLVNSMGTVVASSTAEADSVEHIFFRLGANQGSDYTLRVEHAGGGNVESQDYALAWWVGDTTSPIPGDFDDDGDVDEDDLTQWKGDFGINGDSDANGDGVSDGSDFLAWQRNYGFGVPSSPASAAVPEPAAWMLATIGLPLLLRRRSL